MNDNQFKAKDIIKEWVNKDDEEIYVESDADEQMIIRIPFTSTVKLKSILVKTLNDDSAPSNLKIFANEYLDFNDIENDPKPSQELELVQSSDCIEYPLKFSINLYLALISKFLIYLYIRI